MQCGNLHTHDHCWFSVWAMLSAFILFVPCALGEVVTWITVEGVAPMAYVSKEEASAQAIEDAVQKAVEKMIGTISIEALMLNFRLSGSIAGVIPYVQVVQKEIIEEGLVNVHPEGHDIHSPMYRVKMKTAVAVETTGVDPHFKLESSLNRLSFKDGDEMLMHIKPTKDCYILVFVVLEDGKVLRLIPNRFKKDNFVKANHTFSFPDEIDKSMGIRLKTHGSKEGVVNEAIYIVAFKRPFKLGADKFREAIYGVYNGKTPFMEDLAKEIARIPLSDRAEKLLPYRISSGKVVDGVMEWWDGGGSVMEWWSDGVCEKIRIEDIRNFLNIALGLLGKSVSGLHAYAKTKQISEDEFQRLDTLAYKLENGLLKLVESLERKREQGEWIDKLIVSEINAIFEAT